jgi:hypothetical protein
MFKRWCKQEGFCHGGSNLSHVLMDGGILSVPFDRLNDFYTMYIDAVKGGEKLFVVEQKTEKFHFFVDLDYKDTEELSFDTLEEVCRTICDRVSTFTDKNALISVAEPKTCGELIKHGIHINWSGFVVDHGSAMALHSHIVSALTILFPSKNWRDIVDTSVYGAGKKNAKGSGFRMPWSHKKAKHDACGGAGCEGCEKGRVTQGQYRPVILYNGTLSHIHDREPSVDIMHMATLRTEATEHVIVEGSTREEGSFSMQETKNVFQDLEVQNTIETFIRKNVYGQESSDVSKIYIHDKIFLVSTNSKYCENIQRKHASNHVWFLIEGDTITQKCFCRCETNKGRLHGFCKDFSGRSHILPDKIYKAMYPNGYSKLMFRTSSPKPETPVDTTNPVDLLNTFINKHMVTTSDVKIKSLTKSANQCKIDTTMVCGGCEKINVPFVIKKKKAIIQQKCNCTTREHTLAEKIVKVL